MKIRKIKTSFGFVKFFTNSLKFSPVSCQIHYDNINANYFGIGRTKLDAFQDARSIMRNINKISK